MMYKLLLMMYKLLFLIILLWQPAFLNAQSVVNEQKLNEVGRALANYQVCESLAKQFNDPVMAFYYAQMTLLSEQESSMLEASQLQSIKDHKHNALSVLHKLNKASLFQLCLQRFDDVSRQHYQKLLAQD